MKPLRGSQRNLFLSLDELQTIEQDFLKPPEKAPLGDLRIPLKFSCFSVSDQISQKLLKHLENVPHWKMAKPVLLGSWGRGELSPKSDLDVLFAGPESEVQQVVEELSQRGLRLRYRVPENLSDWSVGVEEKDWLALWGAKAFDLETSQELQRQQSVIFQSAVKKKKILSRLSQERAERNERFDSISNYLEPNLKYGGGGLRDIFQAQIVLDLFADKFSDSEYEKKILQYYLGFFLTLRQKLHFSGFADVLVGTEQHALAKWFGFESHQEFMRQIQRGISRVSFYSDWVMERAAASAVKLKTSEKKIFKTPQSLLSALKQDPSVLTQHQVRRDLDRLFGKDGVLKVSAKNRFQTLEKVLSVQSSDEWLQSVFRSRLIDKLCPRMIRLVGYVQHDQYHRFTADAHILQACREMKRVFKQKKSLEALVSVAKELNPTDWKILTWTCLYHDLAKGIPASDHSDLGLQWVREDFKKAGIPAKIWEEVAWLVKNHLALSQAAFRKNPKSPETWQELWNLDLNEKRLLRLAIFTAVDIRATNPEAWNDWKSKLLAGLVETLRAGETQNFLIVQKKLEKAGFDSSVLGALDRELFQVLKPQQLMEDLKLCSEDEGRWQVYRDRKKKIWVRFHQTQDHPGLLAQILSQLYSAGCSTLHALIHTIPDMGVYDWFQVQTQKDLGKLKKLLESLRVMDVAKPEIQFLDVQLVSQGKDEWVVSFKGVDQKGLLLRAVLELKELGCDIRSARVHTWGRQIEDLFHVRPLLMGPESFVEQLRKNLGLN